MNMLKKFYPVAVSMFIVVWYQCAGFGELFQYEMFLKPESRIEISGDSTIHRWHAKSKKFDFDAQAKLAYETEKEHRQLLNDIVSVTENKTITLTVPVQSLKSGSIGLAGKIRKTMKHKKYPNIVFEMSDYSVRTSTEADTYYMDMSGTLTIIETTRRILLLNLKVEIHGDEITVIGGTSVLMTDYGIKPPRLLFVKAYNKVDIQWKIILGVKKADDVSAEKSEDDHGEATAESTEEKAE